MLFSTDFDPISLPGIPNVPTWRTGHYSVRVTQGSRKLTVPDAFELISTGELDLETNLVVPGALAAWSGHHTQVLWIEYRNAGDIPMPAPLLQVVADDGALLTTNEEVAVAMETAERTPEWITNSVQVLGIGSGATPGVLQPGTSGRIPVYYIGVSRDFEATQVSFSLGSLTAADTTEKVYYKATGDPDIIYSHSGSGGGGGGGTVLVGDPLYGDPPADAERIVFERPRHGRTNINVRQRVYAYTSTFEEFLTIDWAAIHTARPATVPADAWDAILVNLRGEYGDLWASYDAEMAESANYLGGLGQTTFDLGALWGFEVAQASAVLSPVRELAGAVDVSSAGPGSPTDLQPHLRPGSRLASERDRLGVGGRIIGTSGRRSSSPVATSCCTAPMAAKSVRAHGRRPLPGLPDRSPPPPATRAGSPIPTRSIHSLRPTGPHGVSWTTAGWIGLRTPTATGSCWATTTRDA